MVTAFMLGGPTISPWSRVTPEGAPSPSKQRTCVTTRTRSAGRNAHRRMSSRKTATGPFKSFFRFWFMYSPCDLLFQARVKLHLLLCCFLQTGLLCGTRRIVRWLSVALWSGCCCPVAGHSGQPPHADATPVRSGLRPPGLLPSPRDHHQPRPSSQRGKESSLQVPLPRALVRLLWGQAQAAREPSVQIGRAHV